MQEPASIAVENATGAEGVTVAHPANRRVVIGALALVLAYAVFPLVVRQPYYAYLVNLTGIHAILILGLNILVGVAGMVSLGHAGFFAIGAYVSAQLTIEAGAPWIVAFLASGACACVVGIIIAIPTNRMKDLTLALVTLGFGISIYRVLMSWQAVTGGPIGIMGVPAPSLFGVEVKSTQGWFYLIYGVLGVLSAIAAGMIRMRTGRALLALREDDTAAEAMGVNTRAHRMLAFAMSATYCGFAGSLFAHYIGYVSPDSFTFHHSITYVAMVVVGGMGSVAGSLLGAAGLTLIIEYFRAFSQYQMVLYGMSIILFVIFLPGGFIGLAARFARRAGAAGLGR